MDLASKKRCEDASEIALSTILPQLSGPLKVLWVIPMGNIPQWEKEKIRLEQDVSLEKK